MLFNSWIYWGFFSIVLVGYFSIPEKFSKIFLIFASFVFYGSWNFSFTLLLAAYIVFNYLSALLIHHNKNKFGSIILILSIACNFIPIIIFKYFVFFVGNLQIIVDVPEKFSALNLILPVAISFYTFEAISYNVDVSRGLVAPRRNFAEFALFMAFFPRLIAGPIIRPAQFFPQVASRRAPSGEDIRWGMVQIIKGLIKKTIFADHFALIADAYFSAQTGQPSMAGAWIGALAFAFQIYFDFSGYTDIARGCARLLGFDLPINFDRPYLARNIGAFWKYWHISLATWLRDYLYIPLGGNRGGVARTAINLMITMVLGGLWHGASWNFVLWGFYHGLLLCLYHLWAHLRRNAPPPGFRGVCLGVAITFIFVTIGWVPFRAPDFATSIRVLGEMFGGAPGWPNAPPSFWVLTGIIVIWNLLDRGRAIQNRLVAGTGIWDSVRFAGALALALFAMMMFAVTDLTVPFIYFQF